MLGLNINFENIKIAGDWIYNNHYYEHNVFSNNVYFIDFIHILGDVIFPEKRSAHPDNGDDDDDDDDDITARSNIMFSISILLNQLS